MTHLRNTAPMLAALRCGARTRRGGMCKAPALRGAWRCRMHGGGGGAPPGNQNAVKHGYFSAKAIHQRRRETELFRKVRILLDDP
jgi:glucans biosynthesis protein